MNTIKYLLFLCLAFSLPLAYGENLTGAAKIFTDSDAAAIPVTRPLPFIVRSIGNFDLELNNDSLTTVQEIFGGKIRTNKSGDAWLCYHARAENLTYWFLSYPLMDDGKITQIVIARFEPKTKGCDTPSKPLRLSVLLPAAAFSTDNVATVSKN